MTRSKIENEVNEIGTESSMIRSKIKTELPTKNLGSTRIHASTKITKSVNMSQILDLEYPRAYSLLIKSIVDGKLLDDSRTYLLASIGIFCLFTKTISNKKKTRKRHQ